VSLDWNGRTHIRFWPLGPPLKIVIKPFAPYLLPFIANLAIWLDIGSAIADTNGLAQFDDTNAPNFDWRFYTPQPQQP
jgi:hypothetical protein